MPAIAAISAGSILYQRQPFWGDLHAWMPGDLAGFSQVDQYGLPDPNWEAPAKLRNPWETVVLVGQQLPGRVEVTARRTHRRDSKQSPGSHGATPGLLGFDPAEVDITVQIWTRPQWDSFQFIIASLQQIMRDALDAKALGQQPQAAVSIVHPGLNAYGIYSLYLKGLELPRPTGTPGVRQALLSFSEFSPLKAGTAVSNKGTKELVFGTGQDTTFGDLKNIKTLPPDKNAQAWAP